MYVGSFLFRVSGPYFTCTACQYDVAIVVTVHDAYVLHPWLTGRPEGLVQDYVSLGTHP